jgi:hypothetical protein
VALNKVSIIMFPVENLPALVILLGALDSPVLGLHEAIPVGPVGVLHLGIPILVGVALLEGDELVEVSEHVDEDGAIILALEEVIEGELDTSWLEDIDHLANDVFEFEVEVAFHVVEALTLLLIEVLQLVPCDYAVTIEIHYLEPILDALLSGLIFHADDKPDEISEAHLLLKFKLLDSLREDPLKGFPREGVA